MTLAAIYQQPIEHLIPHKRGMIWLERVQDCSDDSLTAIAQVNAANPLYNGAIQNISATQNNSAANCVPAWVGIEWMAQAVSAFAGIHRLSEGKSILLGFLLGTRSYRSFCGGYALGDEAVIKVTRTYVENNLAAFVCTVTVANDCKAEATITVFQPEDYHAYLAGPAE